MHLIKISRDAVYPASIVEPIRDEKTGPSRPFYEIAFTKKKQILQQTECTKKICEQLLNQYCTIPDTKRVEYFPRAPQILKGALRENPHNIGEDVTVTLAIIFR